MAPYRRTLAARIARYGQPVEAAIESMNGARFVHDTLSGTGGRSRSPTRRGRRACGGHRHRAAQRRARPSGLPRRGTCTSSFWRERSIPAYNMFGPPGGRDRRRGLGGGRCERQPGGPGARRPTAPSAGVGRLTEGPAPDLPGPARSPGPRLTLRWRMAAKTPLFSMPACVTFGGNGRRLAQNGPMPPSRF